VDGDSPPSCTRVPVPPGGGDALDAALRGALRAYAGRDAAGLRQALEDALRVLDGVEGAR
jgi:hypothetical protein